MDPIKREKRCAMRKYKRNQSLQILFQYCLTAYVIRLFLSKAFPSLFSALELLIFESLPNIMASLVGPKCLFLLCNVIVFFLLRESNLLGSSQPSPASEIHDDYMKWSRSARRLPAIAGKERERKLEVSLIEENVEKAKEVAEEEKKEKEEEEQEEEVLVEDEEAEVKGGMDLEGEEEFGLPADELYKRSEDFIQRVNMQRRQEAKMMVCGG